ncbi:hypothetical protein ABW286_18810 [Erwinia papayae]|uniref:Uncharacterized protein n=1 Tax=Erwinia papayae TaxID=206499 RepID=A0ABV3N5U6_9GAMM
MRSERSAFIELSLSLISARVMGTAKDKVKGSFTQQVSEYMGMDATHSMLSAREKQKGENFLPFCDN